MDEDQIPDVLKSGRLGHGEPGMRGVYGHVSPAMRAELMERVAPQRRPLPALRHRPARTRHCAARGRASGDGDRAGAADRDRQIVVATRYCGVLFALL
jgi:hypothetical protein